MSRVCIVAHVIAYSNLNLNNSLFTASTKCFIADMALTHLTEEIHSVSVCGVLVDKLQYYYVVCLLFDCAEYTV